MNGTQKYLMHLEMIIWQTLPKGTRLTSAEVSALMAQATPEQKQAALVRGVDHAPLIFPDDEIDMKANTLQKGKQP